jgi:predicted GNAT superfamily acetyltransferase
MPQPITIRPVTELREVAAVEELQRTVWGMQNDSGLVPNHVLITAAHHGGVLLGAFTPQDEMVGFVFGFLGTVNDERIAWMGTPYMHCSHMLAVLPEYRRQAVAYQLKCAQRDMLLVQGLKLTTWTFDPLLGINAWLNIARLGGIVRTYLPNLYGNLREALNAGLPTDRFEVEWWIDSERVQRHLNMPNACPELDAWRKAGAVQINSILVRGDGLRVPDGWQPSTRHNQLIVEIPADFQSLRQADLDVAYQWRMHSREIFLWAFNNKYVIAWINSEGQGSERRTFYILTRRLDISKLAGASNAR